MKNIVFLISLRILACRVFRRILDYGCLCDIADHMADCEGWFHWLLKYDTDLVRPGLIECALKELGFCVTLMIICSHVHFCCTHGNRTSITDHF